MSLSIEKHQHQKLFSAFCPQVTPMEGTDWRCNCWMTFPRQQVWTSDIDEKVELIILEEMEFKNCELLVAIFDRLGSSRQRFKEENARYRKTKTLWKNCCRFEPGLRFQASCFEKWCVPRERSGIFRDVENCTERFVYEASRFQFSSLQHVHHSGNSPQLLLGFYQQYSQKIRNEPKLLN